MPRDNPDSQALPDGDARPPLSPMGSNPSVALPLNLRRDAFGHIFALNCEIRLPWGLCFLARLPGDVIDRGKQTWLRLEGAQESNPCIVVDAGARDGRFDQRTRSGCINGSKAKQPHFLSMALKSEQRFPAEGL